MRERMRQRIAVRRLRVALLAALTIWVVAPTASAEVLHYHVRVDGLACPFCAYGIEKKLGALSAVTEIAIDLEAGLVRVEAREGTLLAPKDVREAVRAAGFTAREIGVRVRGTLRTEGDGGLALEVAPGQRFEMSTERETERLRELVGTDVVLAGVLVEEGGAIALRVDQVDPRDDGQ